MLEQNNVRSVKIVIEYTDGKIEEVLLPINENTQSIRFLNSPVLQQIASDKYGLKEDKITLQVVYKNPLEM